MTSAQLFFSSSQLWTIHDSHDLLMSIHDFLVLVLSEGDEAVRARIALLIRLHLLNSRNDVIQPERLVPCLFPGLDAILDSLLVLPLGALDDNGLDQLVSLLPPLFHRLSPDAHLGQYDGAVIQLTNRLLGLPSEREQAILRKLSVNESSE